jgi:hypothetical protein
VAELEPDAALGKRVRNMGLFTGLYHSDTLGQVGDWMVGVYTGHSHYDGVSPETAFEAFDAALGAARKGET